MVTDNRERDCAVVTSETSALKKEASHYTATFSPSFLLLLFLLCLSMVISALLTLLVHLLRLHCALLRHAKSALISSGRLSEEERHPESGPQFVSFGVCYLSS